MSSKMLSVILIILASIFFNVANGWGCLYYSNSHVEPECQCVSYLYNVCPDKCHIDDCTAPDRLNCNDYPDSRLPSICIQEHHHDDPAPVYVPAPALCSDFWQSECPDTCEAYECRGHFAWWWYLVIAGTIVAIIALILIIVCIRLSIGSRTHVVTTQPQVVTVQPQVVAPPPPPPPPPPPVYVASPQPQPQIVATINI